MSSDDDDDYMSDKFTAASSSVEEVRPGLLFSQKRKREADMLAKKSKYDSDNRRKRPQEQLQEGLSRAIPKSNIGFSLLSKMGYKEGTALGKSGQGIAEPLGITVKTDRQGLGRKAALQQLREKQQTIARNRLLKNAGTAEIDTEAFRLRMSQRNETRLVESDLARCQRACQRLDLKMNYETPAIKWFWPEVVMANNAGDVEGCDEAYGDEETDERDPETDDNDEEEDRLNALEQEEDVTYEPLEKLEMLTEYLRTSHLYCIWCGVQYENLEDMESDCPGNVKGDH